MPVFVDSKEMLATDEKDHRLISMNILGWTVEFGFGAISCRAAGAILSGLHRVCQVGVAFVCSEEGEMRRGCGQ